MSDQEIQTQILEWAYEQLMEAHGVKAEGIFMADDAADAIGVDQEQARRAIGGLRMRGLLTRMSARMDASDIFHISEDGIRAVEQFRHNRMEETKLAMLRHINAQTRKERERSRDAQAWFHATTLAHDLSLGRAEAIEAMESLLHEGRVEPQPNAETLRAYGSDHQIGYAITARGRAALSGRKPAEGAQTHLNIGTVIGSVQTGSHAQATIIQNISKHPDELLDLLERLRGAIAEQIQEPEDREEALDGVAEIEEEIEAGEEASRRHIVKSLKKIVQAVRDNAGLGALILKLEEMLGVAEQVAEWL